MLSSDVQACSSGISKPVDTTAVWDLMRHHDLFGAHEYQLASA